MAPPPAQPNVRALALEEMASLLLTTKRYSEVRQSAASIFSELWTPVPDYIEQLRMSTTIPPQVIIENKELAEQIRRTFRRIQTNRRTQAMRALELTMRGLQNSGVSPEVIEALLMQADAPPQAIETLIASLE